MYINVPDAGQAKLREKLPLLSVVALDPICDAAVPAVHNDTVAPTTGAAPPVTVPVKVGPFDASDADPSWPPLAPLPQATSVLTKPVARTKRQKLERMKTPR
jgi:hypothetical protein